MRVLLAIAVLALGVTGCGSQGELKAEANPLQQSLTACTKDFEESMSQVSTTATAVDDVFTLEGDSLVVSSSNGVYSDSQSVVVYASLSCILEDAGIPATATQHLGTTTPMMGRQSEEWEGHKFDWTVSTSSTGGTVIDATLTRTG